MADLISPRFSGDPILEQCLDGDHRMLQPEQGPAVQKVQQALIDLGYTIPSGATGNFLAETATAVVAFKNAHTITPNDPVVGKLTMAALDADIVTFWINAFIPDPSLTPFVVPAPGAATGKSMIVILANTPPWPIPVDRYFLGDNRGFSDDVFAPARIHSLVEITNLDTDTPQLNAVDNRCGESIEINGDGNVIQTATAPADRIRFLNLRGNTSIDPNGGVVVDNPSPRFVQLDYEAAANLPLLAGSPDIDMVGVLGIDRDNNTFRVRGAVDGFPCFEAYVSFNFGPPIQLFQLLPIAPIFLVGDVKRDVDIAVPIMI
jgi:peptidoglycan hydrolase-like protein with peptidoglycan-binding domain